MFKFLRKNNTIDGNWLKVSNLKVGMQIAVPKDGVLDAHNSGQIDSREWIGDDVLWDEIESIEYVGTEQVWDIEVEDTHNFVGNNIFAHNTYLDGNLGVGTSNPGSKLGVIGNASIGATYGNIAAPTSGMIVEGSVGIGTTAPYYNLDVLSHIRSTGDIIAKGSGTVGDVRMEQGDATKTGFISWRLPYVDGGSSSRMGYMGNSANNIVLGLESSANFVVSGGNVGIGTTAPNATLDVLGTIGGKGKASFTLTGTITAVSGNATVTGSGTKFLSEVSVGDIVNLQGNYGYGYVISIASDTSMTFDAGMTNSGSGLTATNNPSLLSLRNSAGINKFRVDLNGTLKMLGDLDVSGQTTLNDVGFYIGGNSISLGYTEGNTRAAISLAYPINWADINYDNIRDTSVITPTNDIAHGGSTNSAFASFDVSVQAGSIYNYGHLGSYQDRMTLTGSGTVGDLRGFWSWPEILNGSGVTTTVTNRYGFEASDFNTSSAGGSLALTNNYGFYVEPLTKGTNNFAVYTEGTTKSYFGGNVGIGTTAPTSKLQISGGTDGNIANGIKIFGANADGIRLSMFVDDANNWATLFAFDENDGGTPSVTNLRLGKSDGTGLNINNSGNVGIGTTNPSTNKLVVVGDIRVGTSGTNGCVQGFGGTAIAGSCSSDVRLKKDIAPITDVLDNFVTLNPVTYKWRADEFPERGFGTETVSGLIAQDVEKIFPELVAIDDKGFRTVDYGVMLQMLSIEAIKELNTKLNTQSDLEIALTGEVDILKENISGITLIDEEQSAKIETMNLKLGALTGEIIPVAGSEEETFMNNFFANLYVKVGDWLASADNGIKTIFARKISTRLLCIADEAGVETCVEKTQLDNLLAKAGEVSAGEINDVSGTNTDIPTTTEINPNAPVITLVGEATVNLDINGVYNELGANVVDDVDTFVAVSITGVPDNSTNGIYAIHYNAVDSEGNNAIELIRQVIVGTGDYTLTGVSGDSWASGDTVVGNTPEVTTDTTTVTDTTSATTVPAGFDEGAVTVTPEATVGTTTETTVTPDTTTGGN